MRPQRRRRGTILSQRRDVLDDVETITAYALDLGVFLNESELTERRAFIESFVKEIVVMPGNAVVRYTIPISQSTTKPEVLVGGGLGCNERGRSHLLTDSARQTNELAPNGLMTGPSLDR